MASTYPTCFFYSSSSSSSIPNSTSTTRFSLSYSHSTFNGCNGVSLNRGWFQSRICAKFEKFQGEPPQDNLDDTKVPSFQVLEEDGGKEEEQEEDDRYNLLL